MALQPKLADRGPSLSLGNGGLAAIFGKCAWYHSNQSGRTPEEKEQRRAARTNTTQELGPLMAGYSQSALFIYQPGMLPLLKWQLSHTHSHKNRGSRASRSTYRSNNMRTTMMQVEIYHGHAGLFHQMANHIELSMMPQHRERKRRA